eukprot:gene17255-19673_t
MKFFTPGAGKGFLVYGARSNDLLGVAVSRAGDMNGDGYGDIIITARDGNFGSGAAH